MIKKIFLYLMVLFIIGGWYIYRSFHHPIEKIIEKNSDGKKIAEEEGIPSSLKVGLAESESVPPNIRGKKINVVIRENKDEQFEIFDKIEKEWLSKVEEIIGREKYLLYVDLREQNEKEKMQAYNEYHDYLRQKYGDNFSYNISEDQSIREKKINQNYLNDLSKLIGVEKFKIYTATKDQFNEKMKRDNRESIQIEF